MTLQEKLEKLRNHGCTEQEITEIADECLNLLYGKGREIENAYNEGYRDGVSATLLITKYGESAK